MLFDEDFNGYAAAGETLSGKLIRTYDKPVSDSFPTDLWSENTSKYTGGNSVGEPAAFANAPYGGADDYCAYFYSPSTASSGCYDQLIYTFGKNTVQDGDTIILEGKIRNTLYYQNGADSGNFANSFEVGFGGTGGYQRLLAIDSGVTLGTNAKDWTLYNLAGDWLHFSLAVEINGSNMASCPVKLTLSGYTFENNAANYTRSGVADLSKYGTPDNIDSVRQRGIIQPAADMSPYGDTIDTQRHGIYFDDAKIIKAGNFKMSLGDTEDLSSLDLYFNHAFNTKLGEDGGFANVGAESFKLSDTDGNEISISGVDYSVIDPTHAVLTIDSDALVPGKEYTVASTVKDAAGNMPEPVSFTVPGAEPEVSEILRSEQFVGTNDVAYAYTFSVSAYDRTLTGIELKVKNGVDILSGDLTKTFDIPVVQGSELKLGIVASHTLAEGEAPEDVTPPEFEASPIY